MKKTMLPIVLTILLLALLCGCGAAAVSADPTPAPSKETAEEAAAVEEEGLKVAHKLLYLVRYGEFVEV